MLGPGEERGSSFLLPEVDQGSEGVVLGEIPGQLRDKKGKRLVIYSPRVAATGIEFQAGVVTRERQLQLPHDKHCQRASAPSAHLPGTPGSLFL